MEWFEFEELSESSWLRHVWQAYDILYEVQRGCTGLKTEIYEWPDNFRSEIATGKLIVLVAKQADSIIWWLSYHQSGFNVISLDFLWVHEPFRGKWIWSRLLDQLIAKASRQANTIIKLHCKQDSWVTDFYIKKWFKPTWQRDSKTFIKMELPLSSWETTW